MPDESENIEARLAAYIDGDLAEGERRDIEEYLAANPSHAQLITQLRTQRGRLGGLPHEKAPPEVMDHLQQHLERHALLEDESGTSSLRINRWPQVMAAAAMVLLAAGLGLLVYQVLPNGGKPDHLAIIKDSLQHLPDDNAATAPATGDAEPSPKATDLDVQLQSPGPVVKQPDQQNRESQANQMNSSTGQTPVKPPQPQLLEQKQANQVVVSAAPGAAQSTSQGAVADSVGPGGERDYVQKFTDDMVSKQQNRRAAGSAGAPHATLSVTSDDPAMSGALVAQYLAQNGMTFDVPHDGVKETNAPTTANSTQPAVEAAAPTLATMVLHNVTPDTAEKLASAFNIQRAGRQNASLRFDAPATPSSTQPASAADSAVLLDKAGVRGEAVATPAPAPATQNTASVGAGLPSSVTTTAPAINGGDTAKAVDLWIVIKPAPPTITPAFDAKSATQPATQPTTLPAAG